MQGILTHPMLKRSRKDTIKTPRLASAQGCHQNQIIHALIKQTLAQAGIKIPSNLNENQFKHGL